VPEPGSAEISRAGRAALAPVRAAVPVELPDVFLQAGLMLWAGLLGTVSLELFGQFQNVVSEEPGDRNAFFGECVRRWAAQIGIA